MENNNNVNYFSSLTAPLLSLIVSFLPFKEAVRTSILSTQWIDIWKETKNLEFNEQFFVKLDQPQENQQVQRDHFINFFTEFIQNYPRIDVLKLILSWSRPQNYVNEMINFITFAVSRNVKVLELDFSDPTWDENDLTTNHENMFELPSNVYPHANLESLRLFSCGVDVSRFHSFTSLKSLFLGWISFHMNFIKKLLNSCPMLETLSLKKCWNIEAINIISSDSSLKTLVLDKCDLEENFFYFEGPSLKYFKYSGKVVPFHLEDQWDMDRAELDFGLQAEFQELGYLLYEIVSQLYNVRILTLCSVLLQIIPSGEESSIRPHLNARHLILKTTLHSSVFCGIKFMLMSCPFLSILTLDLRSGRILTDYEPPFVVIPQEFWSQGLVVEHCVEKRLKLVIVKGFKGTLNEFNMLRYLLYFGRVMKTLKIYLSNEEGENGENWEMYYARAQIVMHFPKASQDVEILIFRLAE